MGPSAPEDIFFDVRILTQLEAAERHQIAPKTLKAWHAAGLISALRVNKHGNPIAFDEATLDREIAELPRCPYEDCDRPVAEEGDGCKFHRLPMKIKGKPRDPETVAKIAAALRKYEHGDFFCEERLENGEVCGRKVKERRGWQIAKRRRKGGGILRCASCAAKRQQPKHARAKADIEAAGGTATLEGIAAALPFPRSAASVANDIVRGGLPATRQGWLYVAELTEDTLQPYIEWLDVLHENERAKRSASLKEYIATEAAETHRTKLVTKQKEWRAEVQRKIVIAKDDDAMLTSEVIKIVGPMSRQHLTRYWRERGLEGELLTIDGVTVWVWTNPSQVHQLGRLRATGWMWDTWLDPEWRADRGLSLKGRALKDLRDWRTEARSTLRRGPKPAALFGSNRELECARAFIKFQRQLQTKYEAALRAGSSPLMPQNWWAVELAADELIANGWDIGHDSAQQQVWRAVKKLAKPLQIALT
jgi:hypothetical protein